MKLDEKISNDELWADVLPSEMTPGEKVVKVRHLPTDICIQLPANIRPTRNMVLKLAKRMLGLALLKPETENQNV